MYMIRIPRFLVGPGMSLCLGAVCVMSWIVARQPVMGQPFAQSFSQPSPAEAARFLQQSTWGPTSYLIGNVRVSGYESFLDNQFAMPSSGYPTLPLVPATPPDDCPSGSVCRRDN